MKDKYIPHPVDLSDIELPPEVACLTEEIAKNVHDVWSQHRIAEGWTYGEKRDDTLKQTPCLVPYEELPEIEKDYDRNTAINTLKFILHSGFTLTPKKDPLLSEVISDGQKTLIDTRKAHHIDELKSNIEELKLQIKVVEALKSEGWQEEVHRLQDKLIEWTKEAYGESKV